MRYFDEELGRVLAEMAELAGWHPTKQQRYIIYYNGEDQDTAYGESPEEAIQDYLSGDMDGGQRHADITGVSLPEYLAGLTAVLDIPKDNEGDTDFRPADIRLINSEKTRKTLQDWLNNNPTPYRYIIKFGTGTDTKPTPGVITYVKTGNAGGDPLTPHMILHTMGHAVMGYGFDVEEDLQQIFHRILGDDPGQSDGLIEPLAKLLHMKAAEHTIRKTTSAFLTFGELMYEVLAVYVKNGKIKVAPNKFCDYEIDQHTCTLIRAMLERECKGALDRAVGRVVYDE